MKRLGLVVGGARRGGDGGRRGRRADAVVPEGAERLARVRRLGEQPDGSFNMLFGYMNRNWEEELDVPVGPNNSFSPGAADQGQPTHFYPRRNRFVFKVKVPKDWGNKELVWTLTANGKTEKAYATLRPDSFVDDLVQASEQGALGAGVSSPAMRKNTAPTLKVDSGPTRNVKVGEPVPLNAWAFDDGQPRPRFGPGSRSEKFFDRPVAGVHPSQRPPVALTVGSQAGLRVSWYVYRGPNAATFTPGAGQGVGRHPRRRELALGPALGRPEDPGRREDRHHRDLQPARHLRAPLPRLGRRHRHDARRDVRGDEVTGIRCPVSGTDPRPGSGHRTPGTGLPCHTDLHAAPTVLQGDGAGRCRRRGIGPRGVGDDAGRWRRIRASPPRCCGRRTSRRSCSGAASAATRRTTSRCRSPRSPRRARGPRPSARRSSRATCRPGARWPGTAASRTIPA